MGYVRQIGISASEDRLEKLIAERLKPETDKEAIDKRIWDLFGEEWAVMFTDLSGFSRNVKKFGIIHFLQTIHESLRILVPCIDCNDGILLKTEGDSMLVIFRNAQKALHCGIEMQKIVHSYNVGKNKEEEILLCVGIGFGKILRIGDRDVFGEEVNASAKLGEDTAKAWEILVTENLKNRSEPLPEVTFEPLGELVSGVIRGYKVGYKLVD
jgi:class 3 adenylate cyclase